MSHDHDHDHDPYGREPFASGLTRRNLFRAAGLIGIGSLASGLIGTAAGGATKRTTTTLKRKTTTTVKKAATTTTAAAAKPSAASTAASTSCTETPQETAGPFPGDGSNGPNVLTQKGVVRSDIRSSFGSSTTIAKGVPLTIVLTLTDTSKGCAPLADAAVYLWHCDRDGNYSIYSQGVTEENYLRGVQVSDSTGTLTFQSIFPGAYQGRWPHIHFEVYPNVGALTSAQNKIATSQLAFPEAACKLAYAASGYEASVANFARTTLANDNVFRDGVDKQLATMSGDAAKGFVARLNVGV